MNVLFPFMGAGVGLLILIIMVLLCLRCSVDNIPFDRCPSETTQNPSMPLNPASSRQQDVNFIGDEYCWHVKEESHRIDVILIYIVMYIFIYICDIIYITTYIRMSKISRNVKYLQQLYVYNNHFWTCNEKKNNFPPLQFII